MFIVYIFNFSQFIFKSYDTASHIIKNCTLYSPFSPQIFMLLLVYVLLLHVINHTMDCSHLCFKQLTLFQGDLIIRLYIHPHNTSSDDHHSLVQVEIYLRHHCHLIEGLPLTILVVESTCNKFLQLLNISKSLSFTLIFFFTKC